MHRIQRTVLGLSMFGAFVCLVAAVVSTANQTATVPPYLYEHGGRLTTYVRLLDVPLEYWLSVWFATIALVVLRTQRSPTPALSAISLFLGVPLLGSCLGVWVHSLRCWTLLAGSLCGVVVVLAGVLGDPAPLSEAARTAQAFVRRHAVGPRRQNLLLWGLLVLVGWQFFSRAAGSVDAEEMAGKRIVRWYRAQRTMNAPELVATDKLRVVVFTDPLCPVCEAMIPQYASVVAGVGGAAAGLELKSMDFPLDPACNPLVKRSVHPGACDVAVALRVIHEAASAEQVRSLQAWLGERRAVTRAEIVERLAAFSLADAFNRDYQRHLADVRHDASVGASAGVYSTPTLVVAGVKLPNVSPLGLEAVLRAEIQQRGAKTTHP